MSILYAIQHMQSLKVSPGKVFCYGKVKIYLVPFDKLEHHSRNKEFGYTCDKVRGIFLHGCPVGTSFPYRNYFPESPIACFHSQNSMMDIFFEDKILKQRTSLLEKNFFTDWVTNLLIRFHMYSVMHVV